MISDPNKAAKQSRLNTMCRKIFLHIVFNLLCLLNKKAHGEGTLHKNIPLTVFQRYLEFVIGSSTFERFNRFVFVFTFFMNGL